MSDSLVSLKRLVFNKKPRWARFPKSFYSLVNSLYNDPAKVYIYSCVADFVSIDGMKYRLNNEINSLVRFNNPHRWFDSIRPTDICLDVGACIGAFAIPAATKASWVYAIEPLWHQELEDNKKLNDLENITVLKMGIGDEQCQHIAFGAHEEIVETIRMSSLIGSLPQINVAKIDCEGAEWTFEPNVLKGIREIYFEFHIRRSNQKSDWQKYDDYMKWFISNYGNYTIITDNRNLGWESPFSANIEVRAVK